MRAKQTWFKYVMVALVACLVFSIALIAAIPAQAQGQTGSNWEGFYWNNANFQGSPTLRRIDPAINFNWGQGSPDPSIPADNFSVRWYNRIQFAAGTYRFRAGADDGIRVAINGQIVINRFTPATQFIVTTADVQLGSATYEIIVDYYDGGGGAGVLFDWTAITGGGNPGVATTPFPTALPPTPTKVPIIKGVIIVDRTNIRGGPGTEFPTIAQALYDERFVAIGRNGDFGFETWYLFDLGNGGRGWIYRPNVYLYGGDPASLPRTKEVINAPPLAVESAGGGSPPEVGSFEVRAVTLNNAIVRDAPTDRSGQKIGVIPKGATVQVLKLSLNQAWAFVDYEGLQGWTYVPNIRLTVGRYGVLPRSNH
ncbi:MAG: hypothetical protein OHK0023_16550 [Anaerolineae bacterium]